MEENIKILEQLIITLEIKHLGGGKELQNLIKGYRELDQKNTDILERLVTERTVTKVMSENIKGYQEALENSIPKSKVKEKIEELRKRGVKFIAEQKYFRSNELLAQIEVLQELMEDK